MSEMGMARQENNQGRGKGGVTKESMSETVCKGKATGAWQGRCVCYREEESEKQKGPNNKTIQGVQGHGSL